jgi:hypothetical protein
MKRVVLMVSLCASAAAAGAVAQQTTPGAAPEPTPSASPEPGRINLGITPLRVDLGVQSGIEMSQPVRITNSGQSSVQIRGTVMDWTLTPEGEIVYRKRGEEAWGCGKWIQINPVEFSLPPGQTQLIRYTMSAPKGAPPGGYHCVIAFDTLPPTRTSVEGPMGVINLVRMLTAIYATIGKPEVEAKISRLELEPRTGKGARGYDLLTEFQNTGTTHYRVDGAVELLGADGRKLKEFSYGNLPVLPKTPRISRFDVPENLPPGVYRLRAVVDVGTREKLAAETKITVAR